MTNAANTANADAEERAMLDALTDQGPLIEAVDQDQPLEQGDPALNPSVADPATEQGKPEGDKPQTADTKETPDTPTEPVEQPRGDLRKALRAARKAEQATRDENERLRRELEESKKLSGADNADPDPLDYSAEQLEDLKENFPSQYRAVARAQQLAEEVKRLKEANPQQQPTEGWKPPVFDDRIQDVIDQVPQLADWQYSEADQAKFQLATRYDTALNNDPDWADKPAVERFKEAVRRTEAKLGVKPATPASKTPDPAALAAAAVERKPSGISDFRGGGPADAPANDFNGMSDAQILASLDRAHAGTRR